MANAGRRIWLCADDYGISPAVNTAIRELIVRGRINATSVMTAAPHFGGDEAAALAMLNAGQPRAALGLHVTLTAPFKPLSQGFTPLTQGHFPPLAKMMRAALARRLKPERLAIEIATQVEAFVMAFGRPPDFIDGHQHIHLFPQVRDAVLKVAAEAAPDAWVRQCGRPSTAPRVHLVKELLLDVLSLAFRRKARRLGVATNPGFAGAYDFASDFAATFPQFLKGLPDGGLIMCHPGIVDAELQRLDPITGQREREFAYFKSDEFGRALAAHGVALATPEKA
ncbi:MAG: ChbG/HpnK family deacetylase [Pseudolabrys sp.]